jgi:hypothetical protein
MIGATESQLMVAYCTGATHGSLGETISGSYTDTWYDGENTHTYTSTYTDVFVLKLNSEGKLQWLTQMGKNTYASNGSNKGMDEAYSIAVNGSNVYIGGASGMSKHAAKGIGGGNRNGDYDAFVAMLDSSGKLKWVHQFGKGEDDGCSDVATDSSGNKIYCAGETSSSLGETNGGERDAFIIKLNILGNKEWLRQLGSVTSSFENHNPTKSDSCLGVAVDANNDVYCTGYTAGALGEKNGGGNKYNSLDAMIIKYDKKGNLKWISQFGASTKAAGGNNSGNQTCKSIAIHRNGKIVCAGHTSSSFGETNGGSNDAFILKVNESGKFE